jgi:hypothetical protein
VVLVFEAATIALASPWMLSELTSTVCLTSLAMSAAVWVPTFILKSDLFLGPLFSYFLTR